MSVEDAGGLLGIDLDLSSDDAAEQRKQKREERMRQAFLDARESYSAKIDTDGWFLHGTQLADLKDTQTLDARVLLQWQRCINYLYYERRYDEALAWALAYMDRIHVLGPTVQWIDGWPSFVPAPAADKTNQAWGSSSAILEVMDVALRSALHLDAEERAVDRCITAALNRVLLPDSAYARLVDDAGAFQDHEVKACSVCGPH